MATTEQLIQSTKDQINSELGHDNVQAQVLSATLDALVNIKRMEQITEQEKD